VTLVPANGYEAVIIQIRPIPMRGWQIRDGRPLADSRTSAPRDSWQAVLSVPGRATRVTSPMTVGNHVLNEFIKPPSLAGC